MEKNISTKNDVQIEGKGNSDSSKNDKNKQFIILSECSSEISEYDNNNQ